VTEYDNESAELTCMKCGESVWKWTSTWWRNWFTLPLQADNTVYYSSLSLATKRVHKSKIVFRDYVMLVEILVNNLSFKKNNLTRQKYFYQRVIWGRQIIVNNKLNGDRVKEILPRKAHVVGRESL